jgi:hypothetical protein
VNLSCYDGFGIWHHATMGKTVHQETSLLRSRQHARNLDMTTGFDSIQQKQLIMAS